MSNDIPSTRGSEKLPIRTEFLLLNQKMDYLINEFHTHRETKCERHSRKIESLERWRTYIVGASAVCSLIGMIVWERIKTIKVP